MIPTPVVILGAGGLLAGEIRRALERGGQAAAEGAAAPLRLLDRAACDITRADDVRRAVRGAALAINGAAYNAVDRAEAEPELAHAVNAAGPALLAAAATAEGARLVHFSTDFVFDGETRTPYVEGDAPRPLSAYARSKAAGDAAVLGAGGRHVVLRVGNLYGRGGRGFGSTLLARLRAGERVRADAERRVQPCWVRPLAEVTISAAAAAPPGLYHAMTHGETTWADFARALARLAGFDPGLVEPIATATLAAPARRPAFAVLENRALAAAGLDRMPGWREALEGFLAEELTTS